MIEKANDRMNQWTADQNPDANATVQNAQEGRKDDAMEGDRPVAIADPAIENSAKIVEPVIEIGAQIDDSGARGSDDVQMERENDDDPRNEIEPILEDAQARKSESRHSDSPLRRTPMRVYFEDILVPGIAAPHDERHPTPERPGAMTRPTPTDTSIPPVPKMRRLDPDEMSSDGGGTPQSMDLVEERKILGALLSGVDITEIYSPERVAKLGQAYNLIAGKKYGFDKWILFHKRRRQVTGMGSCDQR